MKMFWAVALGSAVGNFFVRFLTDNYVLWVIMQVPWAVWALVALFLTGVFLLVAGASVGVFYAWRRS
jgi:uncharacterized membrane protein YoaK (UPF0700 family)